MRQKTIENMETALRLREQGLTLREIGQRLGGLSRERVRQILARSDRQREAQAEMDRAKLLGHELNGLSLRAQNLLLRHGIRTVEQASASTRDILRIDGIGKVIFHEIQQWISATRP